MATYKLLKGGPAKIDGRVIHPGQKVKHAADLVALFPGRFEVVSGTAEPDTGADPERAEATNMDHPDKRQAARPRPSGVPSGTPSRVVKPTENAPEDREDGNTDHSESGETAERVEELPEGADRDAEDEDEDEEDDKPSASRRTPAKKKKGR